MGTLRIPLLLLLLLFSTSCLSYTMVFPGYWEDYSNDCEASCLTIVFNTNQCHLPNACGSPDNCVTLDYNCLCGTSSWLNASSNCIGGSCGAAAVYEAAGIVANECKTAKAEMALSEEEIIQRGLAAVPSTTQATSTQPTAGATTSPSSPTATAPSKGSGIAGLSTKMQIIIGVVTSIVGVVVAIVGVFFAYKTYKQGRHSAHSQAGDQHHDLEPASSTAPFATMGEPPARTSVSEEEQLHENATRPLPSPQAVAAALRRVDS